MSAWGYVAAYAKTGERAYFFTPVPSQVGVFLQVPL